MAAKTSSWRRGRRPHPPGERYSLHAYWDDMLDRAVPRRSGERLGDYLQRAAALVVSQHPRAQREGEAQAGTVRCVGPRIGRRRPERLSVEPPPRPGAVRRISEAEHTSGPRPSSTGRLSAVADAAGRRRRRQTLTRLRRTVSSAPRPAAIKSGGGSSSGVSARPPSTSATSPVSRAANTSSGTEPCPPCPARRHGGRSSRKAEGVSSRTRHWRRAGQDFTTGRDPRNPTSPPRRQDALPGRRAVVASSTSPHAGHRKR